MIIPAFSVRRWSDDHTAPAWGAYARVRLGFLFLGYFHTREEALNARPKNARIH